MARNSLTSLERLYRYHWRHGSKINCCVAHFKQESVNPSLKSIKDNKCGVIFSRINAKVNCRPGNEGANVWPVIAPWINDNESSRLWRVLRTGRRAGLTPVVWSHFVFPKINWIIHLSLDGTRSNTFVGTEGQLKCCCTCSWEVVEWSGRWWRSRRECSWGSFGILCRRCVHWGRNCERTLRLERHSSSIFALRCVLNKILK